MADSYSLEEITAPAESDQGFSLEEIQEGIKPPTVQPPQITPDFESSISPKLRSPKVAAIPTSLISPEITQYPDLLPSLKPQIPWYQRPAIEALSKPLVEVVPKVTSSDLLEQEAGGRRVLSAVARPFVGEEAAEKLREIPKGAIEYARETAGVEQSVADAANFFTSPIGIATLGIGALPVAAQRTVALVFAAQMAQQVPEIASQLGDELGKPPEQRDQAKIAKLITDGITTTGFTVAGALHGLKPGPKPTPKITPPVEPTPGRIIPPRTEIPTAPEEPAAPTVPIRPPEPTAPAAPEDFPAPQAPPIRAEPAAPEDFPAQPRQIVKRPEGGAEGVAPEKPTTPAAPAAPEEPISPSTPVEQLVDSQPGSVTPDMLNKMSGAELGKYFSGRQQRGIPTQYDGVLAGVNLTAEDVPRLEAMRDALKTKIQAAIKRNDGAAYQAYSGFGVWLNGVIEGAKKSGVNWDRIKADHELEQAAYQHDDGTVHTGANHPEIVKRLGLEGFESPESRNTPQFGFRTKSGRFIEREEAARLAQVTGQDLKKFEPGEPAHSDEVSTPEDPNKPISESGPVKIGRGVSGRTRFNNETQAHGEDLLSWISDNMPLLSKSQAQKKMGSEGFARNKSLYDDAPQRLTSPHHNQIFSERGSSPDRVAQAAFEAGLIKEPHERALWARIVADSKKRAGAVKGAKAEAARLKVEAQQFDEWSRATGDKGEANNIEVTTEELKPGDVLEVEGEQIKVKSRDPDTGDLTLDDGRKFGTQVLEEGKRIYVEKVSEAPEPTKPTSILPPGETERPLTPAEQKEFEALSRRFRDVRENPKAPPITTEETQRYEYLSALAGQKQLLTEGATGAAERIKTLEKQIEDMEKLRKSAQQQAFKSGATRGQQFEAIRNFDQRIAALRQQLETLRQQAKPESPETPFSLTEQTGGERMSTEDVEKAVKAKHPNANVIVTDDPGAAHNGRYIQDANGNFIGIEINAAGIKNAAHLDWVLEHEIGHAAIELGVVEDLQRFLTPDEMARIQKNIAHYDIDAMPPEVQARALQTLAAQWRNRTWFQKIVGQIQAFGQKVGFKMTRLGAERAAAKGLVDAAKRISEESQPGSTRTRGVRELRSVPEPKPEGEEPKPETTGIAERITAERTARGRVGEVPPGQGIDPKAAAQLGRDLIESGIDPVKEIDKAIAAGKIGDDTFPIARAHEENLAKAAVDAERQFGRNSPEYKKARDADTNWLNKVKELQTIWARAGHGQQGEVEVDTGSFHGLQRAYTASTGKEFTPQQANTAQVIATRGQNAQAQAETAQRQMIQQFDRDLSGMTEAERRAYNAANKTVRESAARQAQAETRARMAEQQLKTALDQLERIKKTRTEQKTTDVRLAVDRAKAQSDTEARVKQAQQAKNLADAERKRTQAALDAANKTVREAAAERAKQETDERVAKSNKPKYVWDHIKDKYLDVNNGNADFDDVVHKTATDLGMTPNEVRRSLATSRIGKRMMDDMYAKMAERRRLKTQAMVWLRNLEAPGYEKFFKSIPRIFFIDKVFGHGTVGMITHAGMNIFDPMAWGTYWPNFLKQYAFVFKPGRHEAAIQDLLRHPNYTMWKRAGLQIDPTKFADDYQNQWMRSFMGKVDALVGGRGFDALKTYRLERAEQIWNKFSKKMQTPEMARFIADGVNHSTGVVKTAFPDLASVVAFAPKLEASRWAWAIADPARASRIIAKDLSSKATGGAKVTPEERAFALSEVRQKATIVGTYFALLAANQGILSAMNSKQKINFTDPSQSDFLAFKVAGHNVGIITPLLGMVKLFAKLYQDSQAPRSRVQQLNTRGRQMAETVGAYARGKLSPFAGQVYNVAAGSDYQGRPLPFSRDRVPASLRRQGIKRYTWGEYALTEFAPIPVEETIKEVLHDQGMNESKIATTLKALGTFVTVSTGARVSPDISKGMTEYKARQAYESAYEAGAKDSKVNFDKQVDQISDAAFKNNLNFETIRKQALSNVLGRYKDQYLEAMSGPNPDMKAADKAATAYFNLGGSQSALNQALRRQEKLQPVP